MKKISNTQILKIGILMVVMIALIGGSFYVGYQAGSKNSQSIALQATNTINQGQDPSVDASLFWTAWKNLKDKAVDVDKLNDKDLIYGAITGLVGTLKDPNSNFFPPTDAKAFSENISGEFSGIGAELAVKDGVLTVIAPLKDSPAEHAGIKAGDQILKINNADSTSMTTEDAVKMIRGPQGTVVKLSVMRNGLKDPLEISITRDTIKIPAVDYEMKGNIAYIHLYNFYEQVPYLFYQTAIKMAAANPKGIILDLRGNPGGYLEVSENLLGWFVNSGQVIVKEKFRGNVITEYKADGTGAFKDIPIVVIMDQGSASASEITAGALRDIRGVKLVGTRSFGKGTVQEVENLPDGSLMKITIAHWLTPNGTQIDTNGIQPDYNVTVAPEDIASGNDVQLSKALEVLKQEIAQKSQNQNSLINF